MTLPVADRVDVAPPTDLPLVLSGLTRRHGEREVLSDVSLQLEPGQVLGLLGRNGAGKTTLIQCLLGLSAPDEGESWLWGTPSLALTDGVKQRLGYVPQTPEAFGWMTISEMLDFVAPFYPLWDHDYVRKARERGGISVGKPLSKLSPGERQQAAIIRALAPRPALLVLDEPAAALDPVARRALLRDIAEHAARWGCTVLYSTHIVSDLDRIASHVAILHHGKLLLHEELDTLKERHLRLHVPAGIAAGLEPSLPGELSRHPLDDGGLRLLVLCAPEAGLPAVLDVPEVRRETLTLDDLFVEVAG